MFGSKFHWSFFFIVSFYLDFNIGLVPGTKLDLKSIYGNLRGKKKMCVTFNSNYMCNLRCGRKRSLCLVDGCFCQLEPKVEEASAEESSEEFVFIKDYLKDLLKTVQDQKQTPEPEDIYELKEELLEEKPISRHHIAHFCATLDIARDCIRTCMWKGKPAFCGKDHVCYCGHLYEHSNRNETGMNLKEMYSQFHDLYTKYFGPRDKDEE